MKIYAIKTPVMSNVYSDDLDEMNRISKSLSGLLDKSLTKFEKMLDLDAQTSLSLDEMEITIKKSEVDDLKAEGILYEALNVKFKEEYREYQQKRKEMGEKRSEVLKRAEVQESSLFADLEEEPDMKMILVINSEEFLEYLKLHGIFEHHAKNILGCASNSEEITRKGVEIMKELGIDGLEIRGDSDDLF